MKNNYIHHALCLRNSIAYGHDFWYTCVKWWYLRVFFSLFWNFHFSGCMEGKKTKNSPKWKTAITSLTHHISGTVWHMIMIFGTLVWNDDISRRFFHCFEIFIVQAVTGGGRGRGGEGNKRANNSPKWKITIASITQHISGTV